MHKLRMTLNANNPVMILKYGVFDKWKFEVAFLLILLFLPELLLNNPFRYFPMNLI